MQMSADQALFTTGGVGGTGRGLFRGAGILRGGTGGGFRGSGTSSRSRGGAAVVSNNVRGGNIHFRGGGNLNRGGRGGGNNRLHPYNNNNRSFQGPCYNCGENGHKAAYCNQRQQENNQGDQGLFVGDAAGSAADPCNIQNFFHEDDLALSTEFIADREHNPKPSEQNEVALSSVFRNDLLNNRGDQDCWYIDSAATRHMTFDKDILMDFRLFSDSERENSKVRLGNDYVIPAIGEGKVRLATTYDRDGQHLALEKVAYVPQLTKNLLSVATMTENGAEVRFDGEKCIVVKNDKHYNIGHKKGKLYCVGLPEMTDSACFTSDTKSKNVSKEVWHCRFGHLNDNDVDRLVKSSMVDGMSYRTNTHTNESAICEGCMLGKMTKIPFQKRSSYRASKPLELIHTDLCGPMQVPSHGGSRYVLTFTDDFSRYTTIYFLQNKSDTIARFKEYVSLMEKSSGQRVEHLDIKSLRSDNGGEYTSKEFDAFCKNRGIQRQFSNPYTPEQNGVSERFNRTMIESARSMLYHAKLPLKFWAEAVNTAVYIRNRSPTTSLNYGTPYECWFGSKPDVSHMRVFGSQCFVHIPDDQRRKLDAKSYRGIFVGYPDGTKGYKIYNVASGKFTRTRNVVFDENNFHNFDQPAPKKAEIVNVVLPIDDGFEDLSTEVANLNIDNPVRQIVLPTDDHVQGENVAQPPPQQQPVAPQNLPPTTITPPTVAPTYEETFMNQVEGIGPVRSRKPTRRFIESDECNFSELPVDGVEIPKTYKSALNNQHQTQWREAMQKEYCSLTQKKTWRLVPRPTDKNIVKNKWVYNLKRNEKGEIDRFKARLVAKGYTQTEGVDYDEIFSPVAKFQSIRSLLALANAYDLDVHHMDVTTAFLNGNLDCEIYMEQPEGFIDPDHPDYVCLLDKSLYGLKQSSRCWNNTLDGYLKANDYRQSPADECIYIKTVQSDDGKMKFVILGVYVDDIIPVSNDTEFMLAEKAKICNQYEMVDNGEISYC